MLTQLKKLKKKIISRPLQWWASWYFQKPRKYNYKNIKGTVLPTVFFPHFTISTQFLMEFLEDKKLNDKSLLELGCGSGLISVLAAQKGAKVLASDLNPQAIENALLNAKKNNVEVQVVESDLFKKIPKQEFNYIIINPPYYAKNPKNIAENAWFCGENFEYFEKLFSQIATYFNRNSKVYMILSEDCELENIKQLAKNKYINLNILKSKRVKGETSHIFELIKF